MRRILSLVSGAVLAAAVAVAAPPGLALANPPAILRQEITSQSGRVTLGDLFYDAGDASSVLVARVVPGQSAVLDATQVQILARTSGVDWGNPQGLRRIVVSPGEALPVTPALAKKPRASVLAFTHPIATGEVIHADDLAWSKEATETADAARDPSAVVGMAARRNLREGDAVSLRDVTTAIVIHKDDLISIGYKSDGVSLTLKAKAMENAASGQAFAVVNISSKTVIQAVATGPGLAVVGPEADQFKSAAPSRLALR